MCDHEAGIMTDITPCLWFDRNGEEAANFYVSLLPDSRIDKVMRAATDYPAGEQGDALLVEFTLCGRPYQALNGGSNVHFNQAISLSVGVDTQADVDRLWDALIADGGEPGQCSWLKDKYGLSWQIVPNEMVALMSDPDPARAKRAMTAMMTMTKIDLAAIKAAANGAGE
jgi:predicted 3-demethylubiquinone-9 3-methyltransferase (glyoxalase superfamily)